MCDFINCNGKKLIIIGKCSYCSLTFCKTHRLPEQHVCGSLQECKDRHKEILSKKLLNERTITKKLNEI
jgi:predicted nucleic acid binding AN1-type Zn finger protein